MVGMMCNELGVMGSGVNLTQNTNQTLSDECII